MHSPLTATAAPEGDKRAARPSHSGGNHRTRHSYWVSIGSNTRVPFLLSSPFFIPLQLSRQPSPCTRTDQQHLSTNHPIFNTNSHLLPVLGYFTAGSYLSQKCQTQLVHIKWAEYKVEMWPIPDWAQCYFTIENWLQLPSSLTARQTKAIKYWLLIS